MSGAFFSFVVLFLIFQFLMPGTWYGGLLTFLSFPLIFLGCIAGGFYLMRHDLLRLLTDAKARYLIRGKALRTLVEPLGLAYVPTPGGAPGAVEWLSKQSWAPEALRNLASAMDEAGGMDRALEAARDAGLLQAVNTYVVGTQARKEEYHNMMISHSQLEDGFHGRRGGIEFDMFEWVETVEKAPDVHHLVIVLEAPFGLSGVTQMRARRTGWPQEVSGARMQDVDLGPRAFEARYRLRASDQVEARALFNPAVIERVIDLAHDGNFRAVAREGRLVFDFPGTDRFRLVDLTSGEWGEHTVRQTAADLAEALALVDTLAHAFMLARKPDTGGA
ncbi:DUF3137 domain-containing protein [Hyphomonas sp.]|uniref:DUF3137 domain-containing protein n=1 Tax=Hyphomonas sp. TaxID=87 RepID=UPI0039189B4E